MIKLPISKEQEAEALARVWNMGCQSLDPFSYDKMENAFELIAKNRNIDFEVVQKHQILLSGKETHESDCRTSGAPAYLPGPCSCDYPK